MGTDLGVEYGLWPQLSTFSSDEIILDEGKASGCSVQQGAVCHDPRRPSSFDVVRQVDNVSLGEEI